MPAELIYVVALGAATAVGRDAMSSAAAVRAGIGGITEHPYRVDSAGSPTRVAMAPWLDVAITGAERFAALLLPALDQVIQAHAGPLASLHTAIGIGLPEPRPGVQPDLQQRLMEHIGERYRGVFRASAWFPNGHAAGLLAMEAACRRLAAGTLDACIVAGVDSYMEPETLVWLEECEQLHGAGALNNAWGFIPGEGAGAVLLVREKVLDEFGSTALAQVLGVGTAVESKRIKTRTVCIGEGLTQAFRAALRSLPQGETVTDVYCDMNGEPYRADEYGFTCLRTKEYLQSASQFVAPADCWGDVGAASSPLHVCLAVIAGIKAYANGTASFVWAGSEQGHRAAAVLRTRSGDNHAR